VFTLPAIDDASAMVAEIKINDTTNYWCGGKGGLS